MEVAEEADTCYSYHSPSVILGLFGSVDLPGYGGPPTSGPFLAQ